ncbi:MAG: C1 family peptidase [Candidatus Zixiibacteriota bacterium]
MALGPVHAQDELPGAFDWRDSAIFTPVKHQMNCGSCGEFAAVALFEALIKKETGNEVDLSEQQIVSCVPGCGCVTGCSSLDALKYIRDNGMVTESDFPYLDRDTVCRSNLKGKYFLTEVYSTMIHYKTLVDRITTIKETLLRIGPVATNMSLYDDLGRYREGVYTYDGKSEPMGGHWVMIVGWRDDTELPSGGYWLCRNSWGEKWGEKGYFKSAYGDVTGIDDFYIVYASYNSALEK